MPSACNAARNTASFSHLSVLPSGWDDADIGTPGLGGSAIFENQAFERRMRDIHAVTQQVQAQLVNFEVVGQVLLGLPVTSKLI